MSQSQVDIDPSDAFQALQEFASREIARLFGEIAVREAYIKQLQAQLTPADDTDL